MDERHKQKLERDLERYRALLKLATDQQALAALKQLIKETTDRLNDINNSEHYLHYENTPSRDDNKPGDQWDKGALERV